MASAEEDMAVNPVSVFVPVSMETELEELAFSVVKVTAGTLANAVVNVTSKSPPPVPTTDHSADAGD